MKETIILTILAGAALVAFGKVLDRRPKWQKVYHFLIDNSSKFDNYLAQQINFRFDINLDTAYEAIHRFRISEPDLTWFKDNL